MSVKTAVKKANKESKRKGDWSNKAEISKKIVGRKPADLSKELRTLVKDDKIERKQGASLWRVEGVGGAGAGKEKSSRRGGDKLTRRTGKTGRRRTTRKTSRRSNTDTIRNAATVAIASGSMGGGGGRLY